MDVRSVNQKKYRTVAVGGTFDKLHKGHENLIDTAFALGTRVLIGLTTDKMLKTSTKPFPTTKYTARKKALIKYLKNKGIKKDYEIIPIDTPYGITLSEGGLDAIVVSHETSSRANEINALRKERGLKPLRIFIIKMVLAEDGTQSRQLELNEER